MNGSFAIYVRWLLGWRYISSLHSADESQLGRNSCPLLRSCFIGSCHVGVSKRFSSSISLAVNCLNTNLKLHDENYTSFDASLLVQKMGGGRGTVIRGEALILNFRR